MTQLTLETFIAQAPEQVAAEVDGEVLMMHVESGHYFGLNNTASFIWHQLARPQTVAALCDAVQA